MDIKVGDSIRTNEGIIGKLKRIELDEIDKNLKWYVFDKKRPDMNIIDEIYINKPYITKYSKNLIDLIEVGDSSVFVDANYDDVCGEIYKTDIQTILTHEQYNANCYKIEQK